MARQSVYKGLLTVIGVLSVGLAVLGVFLPLLPTTPFLLLAAACFIRSSDRLYRWLITHRWFGSYIRNYREHKAITKRTKVVTLLLLWATLGFTALCVVDSMVVRFLLLVIGVGVTLHVLNMKTLTPEMLSETSRAAVVEKDTVEGERERGSETDVPERRTG